MQKEKEEAEFFKYWNNTEGYDKYLQLVFKEATMMSFQLFSAVLKDKLKFSFFMYDAETKERLVFSSCKDSQVPAFLALLYDQKKS